MFRLRTLAVSLTLCMLSAAAARAESPYDTWAYHYTVYGYRAIENAFDTDARVGQSVDAQYALVASYTAWEYAWTAITTDNKTAWHQAYIANVYAWYYSDRAARATGNVDLWFATQHTFDAYNWCRYAELYYH
jgi:hypothetical protein